MGDIHLLGPNLHVLWLCLTYTVRLESIVLFIHIFSTHNLLFWPNFWPPPPLCQQWSAFGLPPLRPSSAMVSICHTPSPPSGGWRNMWTAPYVITLQAGWNIASKSEIGFKRAAQKCWGKVVDHWPIVSPVIGISPRTPHLHSHRGWLHLEFP